MTASQMGVNGAQRNLVLYSDLFGLTNTPAALEAAGAWLISQGHDEMESLRAIAEWMIADAPRDELLAKDLRGFVEACASGRASHDAFVANHKKARNRFRMRMAGDISLDDLPEFLIDGIIVENSVHAFYGATAAGKTFAAIDMAMCVATGRQWFGRDTLPAAVLWLAAEDSFGVDKRVRAWLKRADLRGAPFATLDGAD